jgi:hypothetical protein
LLKITVDLHPGGASDFRRTLATMTISNRSNLAEISDYDVTAVERANPLTGEAARICSLQVLGHLRRQSVWKLVAVAIEKMEGAECTEL